MITAISLIAISVLLFPTSLFLMAMALVARNSAGAGMFVGSLGLAALSVMCVVDACHFMIYGTSLGAVQY